MFGCKLGIIGYKLGINRYSLGIIWNKLGTHACKLGDYGEIEIVGLLAAVVYKHVSASQTNKT